MFLIIRPPVLQIFERPPKYHKTLNYVQKIQANF